MNKFGMNKFAILGRPQFLLQKIYVIAVILCLFQVIWDVDSLTIIQILTLNEPLRKQEWKFQISIAICPHASISSD